MPEMSPDSIGYDRARQLLQAELDEIMMDAREQLWDGYQEHGNAWLDAEPRWHYWKGIDELFSATHYSKRGEIEAMDVCLADAFNHILMASYLAHDQSTGENQ